MGILASGGLQRDIIMCSFFLCLPLIRNEESWCHSGTRRVSILFVFHGLFFFSFRLHVCFHTSVFYFVIYIFHVTSLICSTDWWCLDIMCCSRCHSWLSFMTFFFLLFLLRFVFKLWWREGVGYVLFRRFECAVFRQNLRARWDSFESLTIEL